jgi:hypothetical protein
MHIMHGNLTRYEVGSCPGALCTKSGGVFKTETKKQLLQGQAGSGALSVECHLQAFPVLIDKLQVLLLL